jgi:uncharacterized protein
MIDDPKYNTLTEILSSMGDIAVAFSGGLDSTFLLTVARQTVGERVIALTLKTPYIPDWEIKEAEKTCRNIRVRHIILQEQVIDALRNNPENRCYLCKSYVFDRFIKEVSKLGDYRIVDGTNMDDMKDFRPGMKALQELGIRSPLLESKITKDDIRKYSKLLGISDWNKPPYACLLTRIPYDTQINNEELSRIENAELFLHDLGFKESRVRSQNLSARIEVNPDHLIRIMEKQIRQKIVKAFHQLGFRFIAIDLEGYRTGSMNTKNTKDEL